MVRSAIEEEYAKRMTKLAKITLGKDEIGCVHHEIYFNKKISDTFS